MKLDRKIAKIAEALEKKYSELKMKECEELYNAIVDVLTQHNATAQNALFALELAKWQIMYGFYAKIMGTAIPAEGKLTLKKAE